MDIYISCAFDYWGVFVNIALTAILSGQVRVALELSDV